MSIEVVLVRHAERMDETAERGQWARTCGDRYWDPPITQRGKMQSQEAGRALLREHAKRPFSCVHVSPCLRTVQTAAEIAQLLGLPLQCSPGLAECAAAVKQKGIAAFQQSGKDGDQAFAPAPVPPAVAPGGPPPPMWSNKTPQPGSGAGSSRGKRRPRFLSEAELLSHCPEGTRFLPRDETYDEFFDCVTRLAASAAAHEAHQQTTAAAPAAALPGGGGRVLAVTHREGIRDLCELAGAPHRRTPYCCAAVLGFDASRHALVAAWRAADGGGGAETAAAECLATTGDGTWTLLSRPSDLPGEIDPALAHAAGADTAAARPPPPVTAAAQGAEEQAAAGGFASSDVLLAELGARRLGAAEFARLGRAAGMPEAVVADVLRQAAT